ncbi:MAG: FixH family protein [Phycisphaerales bacterium]|nr:FixH family protein [Phycisphaerales bacterium]
MTTTPAAIAPSGNALTPSQRRAARFWPMLVVCLIGGQIALASLAVYLAVILGPPSVEPNYYRQAIDWNAHAAQQAHNQALGWRVDVQADLRSAADGMRTIRITLLDERGRPVTGASVTGIVFHHADGRNRIPLACEPVEPPGVYATAAPLPHDGLHEFRIEATLGDTCFTHRRELHVGAPTGMFKWSR